MTDREKIEELLLSVDGGIDYSEVAQAKTIVAKNQNAPPHGERDGSLTEKQWIAARDAVTAIETFRRSLGRMGEE